MWSVFLLTGGLKESKMNWPGLGSCDFELLFPGMCVIKLCLANRKTNLHLIRSLGRFSFFLDEKPSTKYHWFIGIRQAEYLTFLNKFPESRRLLLRHFTLIHVLFSSIEPWKVRVVSFEVICEVHAWRKPRDVRLPAVRSSRFVEMQESLFQCNTVFLPSTAVLWKSWIVKCT